MTERRREIYAIAQEYDLLIVEDDPYYYQQEHTVRVNLSHVRLVPLMSVICVLYRIKRKLSIRAILNS